MPGSIGEHLLQERFGTAQRARGFYNHQMLDHLNEHMQEFMARMEMVFIATADGAGEADCSFRAGPPGFVCALDERTLVYPEYRGNGVMGSLGNIAENGHIGLLFIDFCGDAIGLHVNGRSTMIDNDDMLARADLPQAVIDGLQQEGSRQPERWVLVDVVEAFIHCSKHIPQLVKRSDLDQAMVSEAPARKSGDYFKAKHSQRPWVEDAAIGIAEAESVEAALTHLSRSPALTDDPSITAVTEAENIGTSDDADTQHDPHEQIYLEALSIIAAVSDSWSTSLASFV